MDYCHAEGRRRAELRDVTSAGTSCTSNRWGSRAAAGRRHRLAAAVIHSITDAIGVAVEMPSTRTGLGRDAGLRQRGE
jgi:hypothetical protein